MKSFLIKLGAFLAIQAAVLSFVTAYGSMDANTNEYMYSLKDKYDLLIKTPSPRIIFIGGSNLAFGLKSDRLKQQLGRNPVNMGLHGRLGIGCMLRMVQGNLRADDVVVISPEYGAMFRSPKCSHELAIETFRVWPGCKPFIQPDIDEPLELLVPAKTPLRKLGQCVARARTRLGQSGADGSNSISQPGCYRRDSFNQFGDHVAHYRSTSTYRENGNLFQMEDQVFLGVADDLNEFSDECRRQRAKIYFLPPPLPQTKATNHRDQVRHVENLMREKLNFPMLTDLAMATFADGLFFDGQSHLNEDGASRRTDIVGRKIQRMERTANRSMRSKIH